MKSNDVVATLVRERDPDRYFAALLAPEPARPALLAIAAFSAEIAGIREAVRSPMPGEIRLQWWRDALVGEARGDVGAHPVASALLEAMARHRLPVQSFLDLIDARTFDLYDDPMPTRHALEGYLGETVSAPIRLAALALGGGADAGSADAAGHAGVAIGITGLLRALPWHAREGRLYLPADILSRHGVTRDDVVLGRGGPGFVAALTDLRALAREHLAAAGRVPRAVRPAFGPAALVPAYLHGMERPGIDPLQPGTDIPAWAKIARLWWWSRR